MEVNVYYDCWQLLQRFVLTVEDGDAELQDAKFELFSEIWNKMQMQHIYSAQTSHIEVIQTTMAALHVGKRMACGRRISEAPLKATRVERIGSIYLLYAIYNKQPTKHFVKIDVSPDTWQTLVSNVEELRRTAPERSDTRQVSYIFWQLVQKQAFRHTAMDYPKALEGLVDYDKLESPFSLREEIPELWEMSSIFKPLWQPLCQLEEVYNKQMAPKRSSTDPITNVFSELQKIFLEIDDLLEGGDPTEPQASTSSGSNNQQNVRSLIRHKAMMGAEKPQIPTEADPEPALPYERRMSSATVFSRKLPDDVLKQLEM